MPDNQASRRPTGARGFLVRHPRTVLILAFAFIALAVGVGRDAPDRLSSGAYLDPTSESQQADAALLEGFPGAPPNLVLIVQSDSNDVDAESTFEAGRRLTRQVAITPGVSGAASYWTTGNPALRSQEGDAGLVAIRLVGTEDEVQTTAARILERVKESPIEVTATGQAAVGLAVDQQAEQDLVEAEKLTLPLTLVVLLVVFGSALATGLPLVVGAASVAGTLAVLRVLTEVTTVSIYALNLTTALGFGLAVDYSLFLVTRFREERRAGAALDAAALTMIRTAGRTVLFSAVTVALSLAALLLFPMPFLRSLGYAGIAVTALAALTALTVVPAILLVTGRWLDRGDPFARPRRRWRARRTRLGEDRLWWHRIAALVMRRPLLVTLSVTTLLVLLVLPFGGVRFGLLDHRTLPDDDPAARAAGRLAADFPQASSDPISVVLPRVEASQQASVLDDYARRLSALPDVAGVNTATGTYREGALVQSPSTEGARRQASQYSAAAGTWLAVAPQPRAGVADVQNLVRDIRAETAPSEVLVGGSAATVVDAIDLIQDRLPWALALIALTTAVLLFLFTGSVLIPVKAIVVNLLSLSATFGALVYVFQEGRLQWLVGDFTATGTIETTLPVLIFCIAFGLSMDYELFLLSRITEAHRAGAATQEAVAQGLQRTGGLITAAALILVTVFLALASSNLTALKIIGVGLTLAVVLDATVIRALLVPAVMRLAGAANWWAPAPLRRLHERLGVSD